MKKTITFIAALFTASLLFSSCSSNKEDAIAVEPVILEVEAGKTVFELLEEQHEIDYSESSMGVFVRSINGTENSGGRFWIYEINGHPGKTACNKAVVSDGDEVVWRYVDSGG